MAFETKPTAPQAGPEPDFTTYPASCNCGGETVLALATCANVRTGAARTGAASEFCGRDKAGNSDWKLQDWWSLVEYRGYCEDCFSGRPSATLRTYSDSEVREAWQWFLGRITQDSASMGGLFTGKEADREQQERYLVIVNHDAKRTGSIEAIPPKYRIEV